MEMTEEAGKRLLWPGLEVCTLLSIKASCMPRITKVSPSAALLHTLSLLKASSLMQRSRLHEPIAMHIRASRMCKTARLQSSPLLFARMQSLVITPAECASLGAQLSGLPVTVTGCCVFQERETGVAVIEAVAIEVAVTAAGIVIEAQVIGIVDNFVCMCTTSEWCSEHCISVTLLHTTLSLCTKDPIV